MILVSEGFDPVKKEIFYRPLGGEVMFGELGENAVRREIRDGLKTTLAEIKYHSLLENIFTFEDQTHHELVLVYEGRLSNNLLYEAKEVTATETGEELPIKVVWRRLDEFGSDDPPLYPVGLIRLAYQIVSKERSYLV
jgi:hypothetical protein